MSNCRSHSVPGRRAARWAAFATPGVITAAAAGGCVLPAEEGTGAAIAYRADGTGYFTLSEGADPALHATGCQ